jgi:cytochrome c oxidase cbb3-type subunit III
MPMVKAILSGVLVVAALTVIATAVRADEAAAKSNYTTFCAKCHGDTGKGNGSGAATLATKPRDFTDCARMAKESDDMLFKVIKEGGKPNGFSGDMAAWNTAFEDPEIKDLVAYIRTLCKK